MAWWILQHHYVYFVRHIELVRPFNLRFQSINSSCSLSRAGYRSGSIIFRRFLHQVKVVKMKLRGDLFWYFIIGKAAAFLFVFPLLSLLFRTRFSRCFDSEIYSTRIVHISGKGSLRHSVMVDCFPSVSEIIFAFIPRDALTSQYYFLL